MLLLSDGFTGSSVYASAFKSAITSKYKEHLSILQEIPESVPMDPKKMAEIIVAKIDAVPEAEAFIKEANTVEDDVKVASSGFSVEEITEETEEE